MTSCHRSTVIYGLLILVFISIFLPKTDAVLSVTTSPSFVARYPTQSVTFTCAISDNLYSVTAVRWYFSNTLILTNGVPISSYSGRASGGTVSSPSLTLTNLVMSDAGSYICSATNSNGENRNSSHSTLGMQNGATPSNVQIANVVGNTISLITGDSIMLNCSASGSPIPNITFWRNGVKIWDGSPYTITNIQSNQAGQYMCVASNYFGQSNSTVQLDVYVKPSSVILSASSTNVNVNQPVTFSCFANGVPSQSYRWYKGNSLIAGQTGSNYQIASAQGTDSGSYQCQAYNLAGSTTSSTVTLTVNTAVAPTSATITSSPSNGQVNEGSTITLTCTSDGTNPSYSWTRNGASTTWNTQSINITNAGSQDTDTYVCQASNAVGSVVRSFSVMVIISPKSVTISPSSSATYSLGNTITLTCSAAGSSPTYTWTHGSRTFQGAVVSIQSAQRTDSGTYVCQASNAAGSSTSSVTVTVYCEYLQIIKKVLDFNQLDENCYLFNRIKITEFPGKECLKLSEDDRKIKIE
ncbi:hypothetical protein KUTeg_006318 [Tegillarca granosa]|uniref:Ig-like domain-containing protein n=1 Tax=Tegillarca granosa TaxID=220873 RepID=A0ABQ9FG82_TEGGR|nr:hypothetical protein KUTeg_006318 [Tegillarca granosa]